jgi:RNA polymerase sigma factor (sigma-70 family)
MSGVLRHIRQLAGGPEAAEPGDADLLGRFTAQRDEAAFADLVRRHGPMVLGVCRRILKNAADAEDAFQATFLILVKKAAGIARPGALGCWLHEVALRTALRARARAAARRQHERQAPEMAQHDFLAAVAWRDLQPVLDEEVRRLPARCREPFVLCYLQGRTYEQAAEQLRCLPGTVSRRLAQARELLRQRLTRRGLTLPAGVLAAALVEGSASAAVAAPLVTVTTRAALACAAGNAAAALPAPVAALVEGGLRAMTLAKTKTALGVVLTVGLLCAGAGLLAREALAPAAPEAGAPPAQAAGKAKADPAPGTQKAEGTVAVTGRVLDPDGKAVPTARVFVLDMPKDIDRFQSEEDVHMEVKDQAPADDGGRFRVRVPRQPVKRDFPAVIAARADGFGLGLYPLTAGPAKGDVVIRLPREKILRVRLVDLQGAPARDVALRLLAVAEKRGESFVAAAGPAPGRPGWFPPLRTNAEGRFEVRGVGPEQAVVLLVRDPRFTPVTLELGKKIKPDAEAGPPAAQEEGEIVRVLDPPRTLRGRVVYADTGKPAAGAVVTAANNFKTTTGPDGHFKLNARWAPNRGEMFMAAQPPPGPGGGPSPYLGMFRFVRQPKGPTVKTPDVVFTLPRGVVVHGKVVEAGSGKAVGGAGVCLVPRQKPVASPDFFAAHPAVGLTHPVYAKADGAFALTVPAGTGTLIVKAARPDYVPVATSMGELATGKPGNQPLYAHAIQVVDVKAGDDAQGFSVRLRRGVPVKGKLVGPDGQPVRGAKMLTRLATSSFLMGFVEGRAVDVPDTGFELGGCDPKRPYPVVFFQEKKGWGAVVELPGKDAAGPLTVRLEPCGKAKVRFVNPEGQPVEGHWPSVEVVLRPGPAWNDQKAALQNIPAADTVNLANVLLGSYQFTNFRTDADGRVTLSNLIPGVTYRISSLSSRDPVLREFTVRPGETAELKDVVLRRVN